MHFPNSPSRTSYTTSTPLTIPSHTRTQTTTTAYPSWPRRSSLSSPSHSPTSSPQEAFYNHSFIISDEELFSDVFTESTASSSTSSRENSRESTPLSSPRYVVESGSLMREVVRAEKAARAREGREGCRRRSGGSGGEKKGRRKSSDGKEMGGKMGTILESSVCE